MTNSNPTIVIVGGVAGGASAATRARRMNEKANIILFEKDEHVSFANCGLPYHIGEEIPERADLLVATPEFLAKRFRIDVRVKQEVLSIDRERKVVAVRITNSDGDAEYSEQSYDKLILAPGASPLVPPLDGVNAPNVLTLRNLRDMDRIKAIVDRESTKRALVVGAGFIGLEMVEQLVRRDIATTLVELQPQVLPLLDAEMVSAWNGLFRTTMERPLPLNWLMEHESKLTSLSSASEFDRMSPWHRKRDLNSAAVEVSQPTTSCKPAITTSTPLAMQPSTPTRQPILV